MPVIADEFIRGAGLRRGAASVPAAVILVFAAGTVPRAVAPLPGADDGLPVGTGKLPLA